MFHYHDLSLFLKNSRLKALLGTLFFCGCYFFTSEVKAQGKTQVVQLSGIVASGDSLYGVPGVTVYVPKAGRGTITNDYGYFSMPVLAGDSVVIRAVGYKNLTVKIPKTYTKDSYSVILELKEDANVLPEVRVWPYPTEKDFRQAFLNLKLPTKDITGPERSLSEKVLALMMANTPMSPASGFKQTVDMQQLERDRRNGFGPNPYTNNPLMNPFAWMKFIQAVKNGDLKKKE